MTVLEVIGLCFINLLSFVIGAKIGTTVASNKNIELNPITSYKEKKQEKKEQREADLKERQLQTMLKNIDNYDGSGLGQEQIPR